MEKVNDNMVRFRKGDLVLELDKSQVFPNDPGEGSPAMVYLTDRFGYGNIKASASYWCATSEEVLMGSGRNNDYNLSKSEISWLVGLDDKLTEFLYPKT